jgi:hypothetical protein
MPTIFEIVATARRVEGPDLSLCATGSGSPLGNANASPLGEHSQAATMGPFMS